MLLYLPTINIKFTSEMKEHNSILFLKYKYKLRTLFRFKDNLDKEIRSNLAYRFSCSSGNATYYSKTYRHSFTRAAGHMGYSNLTDKCVKNVKKSQVSHHLLQRNCKIAFDHFDTLGSDTNSFILLIKESLLNKRDKPVLNCSDESFPLKLFG